MKTFFYTIKRFFTNYFEFKRPGVLPQGVTAFNTWADSIILHYGLPDNDSVRFMLATMILHAKEDACYLSKEYFAKRALKSAANQVAAGVMQDLKAKQEAKIKEEAEAAERAAKTPPPESLVCGAV